MPKTREQQMQKVRSINADVEREVRYEDDVWPWLVAVPDPMNTDHILLVVPYNGCDGEKLLCDWVWPAAESTDDVSDQWIMIRGMPRRYISSIEGSVVSWPSLPGDRKEFDFDEKGTAGELWVMHLVTRELLETPEFQALPMDIGSQERTVGDWWQEVKDEA